MSPSAIVIGAGFAGLAAADVLHRSGVDVVVLEARDRVGGRVWSRERPDGTLVEMGAEFVLPGNDVLVETATRLGLELWPKGMHYGDREPRGGIGVDRAELLAAVAAVERALARRDASRPGSAAELLAGLDIDDGAREAIAARLEVSSADTADRVDASVLAGIAAHANDDCPGVAGGNQRIAILLADQLGRRVHVRSPVEQVVWDAAGVRVRAGGDDLSADACVLSVPASVLDRIAFEPALSGPTAEALRSVVYGHAAKLFVPLLDVPAPSAVLSVPERYWTWTATAGAERPQAIVHAFAGSAPALAALRVEEGSDVWRGSLARLRPDLALAPTGAVLSTWDDDPWVAAAYSSSVPGCSWEPIGRVHFCGEHTAGPYRGLMDGALRSGIRAAEAVLRVLAPA